MQPADDHPVPAGPLAVRWLAYEIEAPQAGTLQHPRVRVKNAGIPPRRGLLLPYPWLDPPRKPCPRSSRTARSPASRRGGPTGTSPGSMTRGSCSELDRDPVVDAAEDEGTESERAGSGDDEIQDVRQPGQTAEEERIADRVDRR